LNARFYTLIILVMAMIALTSRGQSPEAPSRYLEDCQLVVNHNLPTDGRIGEVLYAELTTLFGETLQYECRMADPAVLPATALKDIADITIYTTSGAEFSTTDILEYARLDCPQKRTVNPSAARGECGSGFITNYLNCDGEFHDIDKSYLARDMYVHVDDDYITCIAQVDNDCQLGQSFRTFCTYYPGESAGDYPLGFIHYEKVIGLVDFNAATGFNVSDRQGEEMNWVLCNARDLGYSYSQMNAAIWGILDQVTCNGLCWQARDAIVNPTGLISPHLEFYVPLTGNNVQPQVRNACVTLEDAPLSFICGEERIIDSYVKGLLDQAPANRYIDIPDPSNVESVVAEVWIKPGECPSNITATLGLRASGGSSPAVNVTAAATEVIQTSGSTVIENIYRYTFEGSYGRISVIEGEDGGCNPSSIAVYAVRPEDDGAATLHTSINRKFNRSSHEFSMNVGSTPQARDLHLKVPIHEKDSDGRTARVEAWYTGSPVYSAETNAITHGLEASMLELTLPGVPGNFETISVKIISPDNTSGASFGVGSATISSELACCPEVIATATSSFTCEELTCGPCDGRNTILTMQYTGSEPDAHVMVVQADGVVIFDEILQPGEYFTFNGAASQGTMSSWIDYYLNGNLQANVHTSCSLPQPLVGQQFGDFLVIAGESRNGGPICAEDGSPVFQTTVQILTAHEYQDPVFSWTGPNGYTSAQSNPTVDEPGIYVVEVTDLVTGCTAIDTAEVLGGAESVNCSVSNTGPITCASPSVFLDGESTTQGAVYQWTGPDGFSANTENAVTSVPGTYTLTVTSPDGCPSVCQTVVEIDTQTYAETITAEICEGDPYVLPDGSTVTTGGTYTAVLQAQNGCDSTITVIVTALPPASSSQEVDLCEGESFTLPDGSVVTAPGTYTHVFTAANGCDSVVTTVVNVWPHYSETINAVICQGDSYTLPDGSSATAPGTYTFSYNTVYGCDSVITVVLQVQPESDVIMDAVICGGETYVFPDGSTTMTPTTWTESYTSSLGCDSTVTINVSVAPKYYQTQNVEICDGESYTLPGGTVVTTTGTYTDSMTTVAGCDSILITTVDVIPSFQYSNIAAICVGASYTLPDGSQVTTPGTYITTLTSSGGCDSIITTDLAVVTGFDELDSVLLCEGNSYVLPSGEQTYTAGVYIDTLTATTGCDSVITTVIDLAPQYVFEVYDTICDGDRYELPSGVYVYEAGVYINFYETWQGCDSVITTYLDVLPTYLSITPITICSGDEITLADGTTVSTEGYFGDTLLTVMGCDSILLTEVTILPEYDILRNVEICLGSPYTLPGGTVVSAPGTYIDSFTSSIGCDSVITTILDMVPSFDETVTPVICLGDGYELPDGNEVFLPGTYTFDLTAAGGCDSLVTIILDVAPHYDISLQAEICLGQTYILPGGDTVNYSGVFVDSFLTAFDCDSVITTALTVTEPYAETVQAGICSGDTYVLPDGSTTTTPGTYVDSLFSTAGCDSVITTILIVAEHYEDTVEAAICLGDSYTLPDGSVVSAAGSYTQNLATWLGCDSVITTILDIVDEFTFTVDAAICVGDVYVLPDGSQTGIPGTWIDSLTSSIGCDSVITTTVNVYLPTVDTVIADICTNDIYILPNGDTASVSGIFTDVVQAASGCDSTVTTILTIGESHDITENVMLCDGETYMLPDGSSTTTAGTFVHAFTNSTGCDSVITTIVDIAYPFEQFVEAEICADGYYTLPDGNVTIEPGTYEFILSTVHGCDSIIVIELEVVPEYRVWEDLALCEGGSVTTLTGTVVTAPGVYIDSLVSFWGCDSIITSTVELYPNYAQTITSGICNSLAYTLPDGSVVTEPGTYVTTLATEHGCDSVITTILEISTSVDLAVNITMCDGEYYTLPDGEITSQAGVYIDTLNSGLGCDSIITTTISLLPHSYAEIDLFSCDADMMILESGDTVTADGEYLYVIDNHLGCDSSILATVLFSNSFDQVSDAVICEGEAYILPGGDTVYSAGTYTDSLQTFAGCDSVITVNLDVNPSYEIYLTDTICDAENYILPDGQVVTEAGEYYTYLPTVNGCDSTIITEIIALPSYRIVHDYEICEGGSIDLPNGQTVSEAGSIAESFTTVFGCDSMIIYNVTVNPHTVYEFDHVVCGQASVTIGDFTYDESGTYIINSTNHFGCDSTIIMNLELNIPFETTIDTTLCPGSAVTIAGQTFTTEGEYIVLFTNIYGCDSTYYVNIEYVNEPVVVARGDTSILAGADVEAYTVDYSLDRPLHFTWYIDDTMVHEGVQRFKEVYFQKAVVRVHVRDSLDCQSQDEFRIFVEEDCPDDLIFVPNIISPNFDNANDVFKILNPHNVYISEVTIFNRWGEIVYTAPDFNDPWDGTFRGQPCNPDVYTYFIQGTCASGNQLLKKGNITLMR
jgi:gliding motility-associated-like protein